MSEKQRFAGYVSSQEKKQILRRWEEMRNVEKDNITYMAHLYIIDGIIIVKDLWKAI